MNLLVARNFYMENRLEIKITRLLKYQIKPNLVLKSIKMLSCQCNKIV